MYAPFFARKSLCYYRPSFYICICFCHAFLWGGYQCSFQAKIPLNHTPFSTCCIPFAIHIILVFCFCLFVCLFEALYIPARHKVKIQYLYFRLHAKYFLLDVEDSYVVVINMNFSLKKHKIHTFFYLERFLNMYIQPFSTVVDWAEIWYLMEVSTMFYICRYCVFTWGGRAPIHVICWKIPYKWPYDLIRIQNLAKIWRSKILLKKIARIEVDSSKLHLFAHQLNNGESEDAGRLLCQNLIGFSRHSQICDPDLGDSSRGEIFYYQ